MTLLSRRLRVLHLATRYQRGGSEQRLRDLIAALPDADHEVIVGADSDLELARTHFDCPVAIEPHLMRAPRPDSDLRAVVAIRKRLRVTKADLLVTHQSKAGVVGRVAARVTGRVPVIHSLSMASFGPGYGAVETTMYRTIERVLAPLTARYVVVGADLARRFDTIAHRAETTQEEFTSWLAPIGNAWATQYRSICASDLPL